MDTRNLLLLTVLLTCVASSLSQSPRKNILRVLHQWVFANFDYNSTQDRQNAEKLGYLLPGNVAILDGDYYLDPKTRRMRIFVSTPQFLSGIPATFSEVRDQNSDGPIMHPFPSWDAQNIAACSGPISVYRFHIDKCGLMWVLDSGMVETFLVPRRACNPKVLIYDLNDNDKLVARYDFPEGVVNDRSILITLITESYQNDCRDSIAYIADVQARGLIMFDWPKRSSWRVENLYFNPFPDQGVVRIRNTTFELNDGLFGLALSPATDPQRKLYFHSAASVRESWVLTSVLKNTTIDADTLRGQFQHSEDIREGQSTVEVMTDDGILIYPVLNKNALACWNYKHPLTKQNQHIVYEDHENLQFISGMKLKNKTLLITSSKLQNYLLFNANGSDVKYRVMIIDNVDQMLDNSPCRKGHTGSTIHAPTGGSTPRYTSTTHKPTTTDPIGNKLLPDRPIRGEEDKHTINFKPPQWHHGQPPYWHQESNQGTDQKKTPYEQTTNKYKTTQGNVHSYSETKYHSTSHSFSQHWPQEPKLQKNPSKDSTDDTDSYGHHWSQEPKLQKNPSKDSTDDMDSFSQHWPQEPKLQKNPGRDTKGGKKSSKEDKSSAESFESESQTKPSVHQKPTTVRVSQKSTPNEHSHHNYFDFD